MQQGKPYAPEDKQNVLLKKTCFLYQFGDFTLQIVYAVEFSLAAALSSEAVLAAASHVVNELQLFSCEDVLLQQLLEVVSAQIHDPVDRERQMHLKRPEQVISYVED